MLQLYIKGCILAMVSNFNTYIDLDNWFLAIKVLPYSKALLSKNSLCVPLFSTRYNTLIFVTEALCLIIRS